MNNEQRRLIKASQKGSEPGLIKTSLSNHRGEIESEGTRVSAPSLPWKQKTGETLRGRKEHRKERGAGDQQRELELRLRYRTDMRYEQGCSSRG